MAQILEPKAIVQVEYRFQILLYPVYKIWDLWIIILTENSVNYHVKDKQTVWWMKCFTSRNQTKLEWSANSSSKN